MRRQPVTIGVDARTMVAARRRGTGKNLIDLYTRLVCLAPDWRFRFYYQPRPDQDLPAEVVESGPNAAFVPLSIRGDRWRLWEQIRLPWQARRDRLSLLHCPAQTAPLWKPVPTVVTIHDLIPIRFDEGWPARRVDRLRRNIARSMRDAAAIITVSDYSRQDLLAEFPEAGKQTIERIYWAPETSSRPLPDDAPIRQACERYGVRPRRFLFALGAEAPRKNTEGLLRAFALASEDSRFDLELLVGGLQRRALERWQALANGLPARQGIRLFGYLPDEDMTALYNAALAFVFPSHYEGFGLPLLDAMACGCPVLASRRTSVPEIAGDACLYFDPERPEDMAASMTRIATESALQEHLRQAGLRRVAQFDWQRTATQVHGLFRNVIDGSGGLHAAQPDAVSFGPDGA
jgi:glycosyltransferase involved in cell wall biosynthesis